MPVRLIPRGFLLSCLLAATSAVAGDAVAVTPTPPSPELVRLDQELTGAQMAKEQGRLAPEKYQAFLGQFRADLDAVKPRIPPVPADTVLHARILSRLGERGQAAGTLGEALKQDPGSADLSLALGHLRLEEGNYPAALAQANAVLKRDPGNYAALALKHSSSGRVAPGGTATAVAALPAPVKSMTADAPSTPGGRASRTSKQSSAVPFPESRSAPGKPAPESPSPLVPLAGALGFGMVAYAVNRSKGTYESKDGFDEEHRPPYGRGQRFVAGAVLAGLAGAGIYFLGVAALSIAPAAIRQMSSFGNQGLRLAQSQTGAINPGSVNAAEKAKTAVPQIDAATSQVERIVIKIGWNPLTGPGPLGEKVARTFRGASYSELVTTKTTALYRVWGGPANEIGPYWTRTPPAGPLQSTIDSALAPAWGNTAINVTRIDVPAGVRIFEGFANPQGGLVGGGNQVFLPKVDPTWIVK